MTKFLGVEPTDCDSGNPRYRVIPFGLEKTVTFGKGTAGGPLAILEASREVETFDIEYLSEIYQNFGVETLEFQPIEDEHQKALSLVSVLVEQSIRDRKVPVVIGGEHSVSAGTLIAFLGAYPDDLVIVQFDAHCDLRNVYLGNRLSHACAMRRCLDGSDVKLVSIGIRNISREEQTFIAHSDRVHLFTSHHAKQPTMPHSLDHLLRGKNVYLTFDVDCLDPSIMPSTGTPEPGGLSWETCLQLLRSIASVANVVGIDVVELAPIKGMLAPNFLTARLIYKMMSYFHRLPMSPLTE